MTRAAGIAALALASLVAATALLAWAVLAAPAGPPPSGPAPQAADLGRLVAPAGVPGQDRITASAADINALLAAATAGTAAGRPAAAAWVTLAGGALQLHVTGALPPSLPLLGGRPWEIEAVVAAQIPSPGHLVLTLRRLDLGRFPLTALLPPGRVVAALAARLPAAAHPWWTVHGAALDLDLARAPPLPAGQVGLHLVPSSLAVGSQAVVLTASVTADFTLSAAAVSDQLQQILNAAGAQGAGIIPVVRLEPGTLAMALTSIGADGRPESQQYALVPSVPRPGVVQLTNAAVGDMAELGALLRAALGPDAQGLAWDGPTLTLDLRSSPAFDLGGGVRLRLLPTAVTVDPTAMTVDLQVLAGA